MIKRQSLKSRVPNLIDISTNIILFIDLDKTKYYFQIVVQLDQMLMK